nr:retrotransposon protein, putative, Ty3-gypsy subclass [Tanacetum cinerariifolium]
NHGKRTSNDPNVDAPAIVPALVNPDQLPAQPVEDDAEEEEEEEDLEEDPEEDPEEEPGDDDDVMEMDDKAEVIDPYMDDGSNNPPPPNSEDQETPPTSPVIPDADGQPIPLIASFGENFHFGKSSSTANLLTGNSKIVLIGPTCLNLGMAWKRLGKMEKIMSEMIDTEGRVKKKFKEKDRHFVGLGAVGLIRWIENTEMVFTVSKCTEANKVMFAAATFQDRALTWWNSQVATLGIEDVTRKAWAEMKVMMTEEFCPPEEIQRMECELWNLRVKKMNISSYTTRFNELVILCPGMVPTEQKKVEAYIQNIKGEVTSSEPTTLNKAVRMAHTLMEQKVKAIAKREADNKKRKWENFQGGSSSGGGNNNIPKPNRNHQNSQRRGNARAMTNVRNQNTNEAGQNVKCNRCGMQHYRNCPIKCNKCGKIKHKARDCWSKVVATGANAQPIVTCYGCGEKGYIKTNCPARNNPERSEARGQAYALRDGGQNLGPNVVTDHSYEVELADGRVVSTNTILRGCALILVNHLFEIDLMPIELGAFDVIIRMDWLILHDAVIVCGKKEVYMPLKKRTLVVKGNDCVHWIVPVICEFPDVFPEDLLGLPPPRQVEFEIELVLGAAPVARAPYLLAPLKMEELAKQSSVYSKIDLRSGYHQLRVQEKDILITAFKTRYGHYEFQVMSFGLTNAPANKEDHEEHLKIILELLHKEKLYVKFSKCELWLDSVKFLGHMINSQGVHVDPTKVEAIKSWAALNFPTETKEEHEEHLRIVLGTLRQKKLYVKFSKCEFWLGQVAFLGHIVLANSITMDPAMVEAITKWLRLKTVTEIRSFFGLAGYYRRFVEGFSRLALPLTKLMRKGEIDASKKGLGCVLMNHSKVIDYASRQLKPYEANYPTYDLELAAVANVVADAVSRKSRMLANLQIEPEIIKDLERIDIELCIRAQKEDVELWDVLQKFEEDEDMKFWVDNDGVMWFGDRLCVPSDPTLREDEISMDFVTGLPRTQKKNDAIWVVVDRLTKSAHFLPIHKDFSVSILADIFYQEIQLHGTPVTIVSDRDPCFTSRFWKGLQNAWGTRLKFSTAFYLETDKQTEWTIQTLEDMLRSCALEWTGNWDEYLCLVEFTYNNRFKLIEVTNEKVTINKEKLKEARSRQKSYADRHRRELAFNPGDRMFLNVSPCRVVRRFGIKGKLSPRFIGPFEFLDRVGEVSYRLALPPQLSHIHNVFQQLEIPKWKWENVTMEFVTGLPRTPSGYDSIWVIVDRLTKSAHFLPKKKTDSIEKLAEMYLKEIVCRHGVPVSVISDRDSLFTLRLLRLRPCMGGSVGRQFIEVRLGKASSLAWNWCFVNDNVVIPLDEVQLDDKLHFVEEPVEIIDQEEKVSSSLCKKTRDKARQAPGRRFLKEGNLELKHEMEQYSPGDEVPAVWLRPRAGVSPTSDNLFEALVVYNPFLDLPFPMADDQPMWGNNRAIAPTLRAAIIVVNLRDNFTVKGRGTIIQIFYHGLDKATQAILDAEGIFLYKTPNEAYQLLEDRVLLKLDWSKDMNAKPIHKTIHFAESSNNSKLMEKMEALTTKIDLQFKEIKGEMKEMRDGCNSCGGPHPSLKGDDTPMGGPKHEEANYA